MPPKWIQSNDHVLLCGILSSSIDEDIIYVCKRDGKLYKMFSCHDNAHIDDLSAVKTRKSKITLLLYTVFRHLTKSIQEKSKHLNLLKWSNICFIFEMI